MDPLARVTKRLTLRIERGPRLRGFKAGSDPETMRPGSDPRPTPAPTPLEFVCEEDVRVAIQAGRKLVLSERAIVTPAARDLGEHHRVFTVAPWRG